MAEAEAPQDAEPKKKSKLPLIIGLVLFLVLGGAGFFAVYSGMILAPAEDAAHQAEAEAEPVENDFAFVAIPSLTISLGAHEENRHLRFTAQLEVSKAKQQAVTDLMPRILDVVNGYMRAVEMSDLQDPDALVRLRSQMLRRIQIVTGEGFVRDLLVTEFVMD